MADLPPRLKVSVGEALLEKAQFCQEVHQLQGRQEVSNLLIPWVPWMDDVCVPGLPGKRDTYTGNCSAPTKGLVSSPRLMVVGTPQQDLFGDHQQWTHRSPRSSHRSALTRQSTSTAVPTRPVKPPSCPPPAEVTVALNQPTSYSSRLWQHSASRVLFPVKSMRS